MNSLTLKYIKIFSFGIMMSSILHINAEFKTIPYNLFFSVKEYKIKPFKLAKVFKFKALPVLTYNHYDRFSIGLIHFNHILDRKKHNYVIMPVYSFKSKKWNGYFNYHYFKKIKSNQFNSLKTGVQGQLFGTVSYDINSNRYYRLNPFIELNDDYTLKEFIKGKNNYIKNIRLDWVHTGIINKYYELKDTLNNPLLFAYPSVNYFNFIKLSHTFSNFNNDKFPFLINSNIEVAKSFRGPSVSQWAKLWVNLKGKYIFEKKKYFKSSFFAGIFLYQNQFVYGNHQFNAVNVGANDYRMQQVLMGRQENYFTNSLFSRQIIDGNNSSMRHTLYYVNNDKWMLSSNNEITLPGKIPFNLYLDLNYTQSIYYSTNGKNYNKPEIAATMGLNLPIFKEVVEFFMPFYFTKNISSIANKNRFSYGGFKFNINKLHPLDWKINALKNPL